MVTEIALFTAVPGKEEALGQGILKGLDVIRRHPGCVSARAQRGIEHPNQFMATIVWTSLDAHIKDFRNGPLFSQWRSHINGLFEGNPNVTHYEPF